MKKLTHEAERALAREIVAVLARHRVAIGRAEFRDNGALLLRELHAWDDEQERLNVLRAESDARERRRAAVRAMARTLLEAGETGFA